MPDYLKLAGETLDALRTEHGADVEGNVAYRAAKAVGDVAGVVDPVKLEAERQRQKVLTGPAKKVVRHSIQTSRDEFGKVRRSANRVAGAVKRAEDLDPKYKAEAANAIAQTQTALKAKPEQSAVDRYIQYAGKAISGTLGLFDALDRQLRHLTTPGRPADVTSLFGDKTSDVTSQEWNDRIRERVGKLERPGDLASNFAGAAGTAVGEALSPLVAPVYQVARTAADLVEGKGLPSYEDLKKSQADAARDTGDLARSVIFSPLNVVGGFKSGWLKVAEQIVEFGKKAGVADDALRQIAKRYLAEFAASPGPKESLEAGIRAAEAALGPDAARQVFGPKFEFLGKEGLKVGVGKASVEIPVQKAVKAGAQKLGLAGADNLFDPAKEIAKVTAKRAKVARVAAEQRGQAEWADLAKIAAHQGVTPKRLDDLIQRGAAPGEVVVGEATNQGERIVAEGAREVLARQPTIRAGRHALDVEAPVGALSTKRGFDAAVLSNAKEQARTVGERFLDEELAKQFGGAIPPVAQQILKATDQAGTLSSMSRTIARFFGPDNKFAQVAAWWERQANAMKQGVLMRRPGYHTLNVWTDAQLMYGAGMTNPVKYLNRADGLMKAAKKGDKRAVALLEEAQKEGIAVDAIERAEYYGSGGGEALRRTAAGKDPRTLGQRIPNQIPLSDAFATRWENTSKLAMFLWGREQGMPTWAAAKTAFDNLIDYGDRGRALQIARWFTPFITWAAKMPKIAATQIAQRPARSLLPAKAINQYSGDEYNEPRSYLKEREMMKSLPEPLTRLYGAAREAIGGSPLSPGETVNFAPSLTIEEGFQLPRAAAQMLTGPIEDKTWKEALRPLAGQLGPGWKAAFESVSGTDLQTGQPLSLKPLGLLPAEVAPPWVPDQLVTTGKEEHGLIPRHFTNYLPGVRALGPGAPLAANISMHELASKPTGQETPVSYYGINRPFSYDANPRDAYLNQLLNFATGAGVYSTLPEGATWSAAHARETQEAIKEAQFQRKKARQGRKNR